MLFRPIVWLLAVSVCAHAATPQELKGLVDQAHALSPEFAANVLLRVAASPPVIDLEWKHVLIEDAFWRAGYAPARYPSPASARLSHGVDALTLQTRAVQAMLALDRQRALTMFRDIPSLLLLPMTCAESLTPDVTVYYQTAIALLNNAFTKAQRAKKADIAFLREQVAGMRSPIQVAPVLKLLDQVELSETARTDLVAAFAVALNRVEGGDREFGVSENLLMGAAVPEMHETLLLPAMRAYIVRRVSGPRCTDQIRLGRLPESVTQFNALISRIDPKHALYQPITADEAKPLRDDGTFADREGTQSASARSATEALWDLQREERAGTQSAEHYYAALRLIEGWGPEDDSYQVASRYVSLLALKVAGDPRRAALTSALHFLEAQYHTLNDQTLWAEELRMLFDNGRVSKDDADGVWLADQLLHSRNPVVAAYAEMERLLGSR